MSRRTSQPAPSSSQGLQLERTTLAWRRTALSVAVTSAVVLHSGAHTTPVQWAIPLGVATVVWLWPWRRSRAAAAGFDATDRHRADGRPLLRRMPDGRAPAGLALLATGLAIVGLVLATGRLS